MKYKQATLPQAQTNDWIGYGLVLIAGTCWACLGLFFRLLEQHAVPATLIALNRAALAGLTLLGLALVRQRATLFLRWRDVPLFGVYGAGIAAFFMIYIEAVDAGSVALAAVLLYTAPVWIALIAWWRWKEPLTVRKIIALSLAVLGSAFVAVGSANIEGGSWAIVLGLLSGFAYALYSVFSNEGLRRGYAPTTIVMYAMLIAAVCLLPFQDWNAFMDVARTPATWPLLFGVAFISTLLAPVCYAAGQQRIGASVAGILATVEPVVAAMLAWMILQESLAIPQLLGGACVLAAVIILAQRSRPQPSGAAHD